MSGWAVMMLMVYCYIQGKGPKRVGALYVTCQLFKVYFKVSGALRSRIAVVRDFESQSG